MAEPNPSDFLKRLLFGNDPEPEPELTEDEKRFQAILADAVNAAIGVRDASRNVLGLYQSNVGFVLASQALSAALASAIEKLQGVRYRVEAFAEENSQNAFAPPSGPTD